MIAAVFGIMIALLACSAPIAIALGWSVIAPVFIDSSFPVTGAYIIRSIISGADSTPLLAIPLFVLSGAIMARGGISKRLFDICAYFIGKRTGGMPCAVILTCLFYGAISGSGPATCAAVGAMAIPVLIELGYDKVFAGAVVASASGLGIIIPPSIPFILWGMATGASVGNLFIAGIIPGILIATVLMLYTYYYCRKHGEDKALIEENYNRLHEKGFWKVMKDGFWALMTPVLILGGIYSGIVTPTEAACISVIYSLIISLFVYRSMELKNTWKEIIDSVKSYAPILALIAIAGVFSRVLALLGAPQAFADWMLNTFGTPAAFLIVLNIVLIFLGMLIDVGPMVVIIGPLLAPIATALGIDLVHLGVVVIANLAIGFISPPFGLNLFVAAPMIDTPPLTLGKKGLPYCICILIALLLITYIPAISLAIL